MEVFILVLLVAFLFYIKSALDSKFDRIEDKMEEEFRELNKKIDLLKGNIILPEKPLIAPEGLQPKVSTESPKPLVVIEKTEPLVFSPVKNDTVDEKTEKAKKGSSETICCCCCMHRKRYCDRRLKSLLYFI